MDQDSIKSLLKRKITTTQSEISELTEDKIGLVHHSEYLQQQIIDLEARIENLDKSNTSLLCDLRQQETLHALLNQRIQINEQMIEDNTSREETPITTNSSQSSIESPQDSTTVNSLPNDENSSFQKMIDQERESHRNNVNSLKHQLRNHEEIHEENMNRLRKTIEDMYADQMLVERSLGKQLNELKNKKDDEIRILQNEIMALKRHSM